MEFTTDIHSHILPGLDDGAPDIKMSVEILKGLSLLGYKKVWATPHISYLFPNDHETIFSTLPILQERIRQEEIPIELFCAAEYMFDNNFVTSLSGRNDLLTLPNRHLLLEFSMTNEPIIFYKEILFDLQLRGYKIILAHPERYPYFYETFSEYNELKQIGLLFQVNLLSFDKYYGKFAQKIATKLAKKGMIDFLATDIHNSQQIGLLRNKRITKSISGIVVKNDLLSLHT